MSPPREAPLPARFSGIAADPNAGRGIDCGRPGLSQRFLAQDRLPGRL
jgi:hypothetical protein